jgi:hypothetical protein
MMNVFCIMLLGEDFYFPERDEKVEYGFYRNEYVLTSSRERAIAVAKARTLKKLAKQSIEPGGGGPVELEAESITRNLPLSRLLRNEGFLFFRMDSEEGQEDQEENCPFGDFTNTY